MRLRQILSIACLALLSSAAGAADIAIIQTSGTRESADVLKKLRSTGLFGSIKEFDGSSMTPSVMTLVNYDAVLVYSDSSRFANSILLGDNLADYVDAGGGVVEAVFANGSIPLRGRFRYEGYEPITGWDQSQFIELFMVIDNPAHPVMNGVALFSGGTSSFHTSDAALSDTATLLARWTNGLPLIAVDDTRVGRTVGLNFYPPSRTARDDFWRVATDGKWILGNALDWAAGDPKGAPTSPVLSASGSCPGVVTFAVTGATPDGTLTMYQSAGTGSVAVTHGMCAGTITGLDGLAAARGVNADASGSWMVSRSVAGTLCGAAVQIVDRESCSVSNVVFVP